MPGRKLRAEDELVARGYGAPEFVARRAVLKETLTALSSPEKRTRYQRLAADNLARWRRLRGNRQSAHCLIRVVDGDWGEVTATLTQKFGVCFAALNMANAYLPGGAYIEGTAAQEENMFRRTDCHFSVDDHQIDPLTDRYRPAMVELLSAVHGSVYLDTQRPRVCVRGCEDRSQANLGYRWLADDEVFPYYELRAAAQKVEPSARFDAEEARRRIASQLDTLRAKSIRYAVLSAFGCGAFHNPANVVAKLYREELDRRREAFSVVAFAIVAPGYGPDNYAPFADAFR